MSSKEILVARLLEDKSITAEEAVVLLRETVVFPDPTRFTKLLPYVDVPGDNDMVPYATICGCNPANGGSGMCGCIMGNDLVPRHGTVQFVNYETTITGDIAKKE